MKNILTTLAVLLFTTAACAGEVLAPFGLTWGETKSQLEHKGMIFTKCTTSLFSLKTTCASGKPIKPISFGKAYQVTFDGSKGLRQSVVYGHVAEGLFEQINSFLIKKYGQPAAVSTSPGTKQEALWKPDGGGQITARLKHTGQFVLEYTAKKSGKREKIKLHESDKEAL